MGTEEDSLRRREDRLGDALALFGRMKRRRDVAAVVLVGPTLAIFNINTV